MPGWEGLWRIVFQIATDESGALLSFLAAGVRHQPRGVQANAHQVARTTAFMGVGRAGRAASAWHSIQPPGDHVDDLADTLIVVWVAKASTSPIRRASSNWRNRHRVTASP